MDQKINHSPLSLAGQRPIGILAIHGFTGSPWSMRPLAEFFAQAGYAVELIRLPGHGSRWEDMLEVTRHDWLAEVDAAYWRLRAAGHQVVVVGLSMGGMLALRQSARRDVLGTVVINPFVTDPSPLLRFAKYLSKVVVTTGGIASDIAKPGVDEGGYKRLPLVGARELYLLGRESRPMLPSLSAPVLYFRSQQDHVVPASSYRHFQKVAQCPVEFVELERSYHVATLDYDAPQILDRSLKFIEELEKNLEG